MDETTDIENNSQLSVFIRWADGEEIKEDILCMEKLEGKTTGKLALELLKIVLEKSGLNLKNMSGVTTDGAANMVGKNIGLHRLLKKNPRLYVFTLHYTSKCIGSRGIARSIYYYS